MYSRSDVVKSMTEASFSMRRSSAPLAPTNPRPILTSFSPIASPTKNTDFEEPISINPKKTGQHLRWPSLGERLFAKGHRPCDPCKDTLAVLRWLVLDHDTNFGVRGLINRSTDGNA